MSNSKKVRRQKVRQKKKDKKTYEKMVASLVAVHAAVNAYVKSEYDDAHLAGIKLAIDRALKRLQHVTHPRKFDLVTELQMLRKNPTDDPHRRCRSIIATMYGVSSDSEERRVEPSQSSSPITAHLKSVASTT